MLHRRLIPLPAFIFLLAVWPVLQATAQEPQQQDRTPIQIVTRILWSYKIGDPRNIPNVEQVLLDFGAPELAGLIREHLECKRREGSACYLPFNPFVWSNDFRIERLNFRIEHLHFRVISNGPDRQTVEAWFKAIGRPTKVHFQFIRQSGQWYLNDIAGPLDRFSEPSLLGYLRDHKDEFDMLPSLPDRRLRDPRSPERIVSDLFKPYLREGYTNSTNALRKVSSDSLLAVLDANRACQHRTSEDCDFSVSPITWADDPIIRKLQVRATRRLGDRQLVIAAYLSPGYLSQKESVEVHYHFIRERGSWRIDDIEGFDSAHKLFSFANLLRSGIEEEGKF